MKLNLKKILNYTKFFRFLGFTVFLKEKTGKARAVTYAQK